MQFGGAFWQTFKGFQFASHSFDQLFATESTTLSDVLDDDNVIQELKNQNQKLHDFLTPSRIMELLQLITIFPPEDADHKRGHKFPFIASELFSCESAFLLDSFFSEKSLLEELFRFFSVSPVNPTLAGYVSKLVIALLGKRPQEVIGFISEHEYLQPIVSNMNNKSVAELAGKILMVESNEPSLCLDTRCKLVGMVTREINSESSFAHCFIADLLCEFILKSNETNSWRDLMAVMAASDNLKIIIDAAGGCVASKTSAALKILRTILSASCCDYLLRSIKTLGDDDSKVIQEEEEASELVKSIVEIFPELVRILARPTETVQSCLFNKPTLILGEDRLRIIEFFHTCLKLSFREIDTKMVECKVLEEIIELFFKFEMNSMLHTAVEQIICSVISFKGYNDCLIQDLLEGPLITKMLECPFGKGFSGHLTKIANLLIKSQSQDCVKDHLSARADWSKFIATELKKKNEIESSTLGDSKKICSFEDTNQVKISNFLKGLSLSSKNDVDIEAELEKAEEIKCSSKEPEIEDTNSELNNRIEEIKEHQDDQSFDEFERDRDLTLEDLKKPSEDASSLQHISHFAKEIAKSVEIHAVKKNSEEENDASYWRFGSEN